MPTSPENRFTSALTDLQRLARDKGISIAIVGGLGAIRYGYPAATQDIDIAIAREQLNDFVRHAKSYGFTLAWESKLGWHTLMHDDVEINVVPEGGKARDSSPTTIPSPVEMGVVVGLDYARLESWVELKISSGRQKDHAHIVEVLKKTDQSSVQRIQKHLQGVHADYLSSFNRLRHQSQDEANQENQRR